MHVGAERIPSLDRLLRDAAFTALLERCGHDDVTRALRGHLEGLRTQARAEAIDVTQLTADAIARVVDGELQRRDRPNLRAVFNLTGTVLHTNLGRSPLPDAAVEAVVRALRAPVNLEFDLENGKRG